MKKINTNDLKKGVWYILTADYFPCGGSLVNLVRFVHAKETYMGGKGKAAVVKSKDGKEFVIHPEAYLFVDD